MINCMIGNNINRKSIIIDENTTLRNALEGERIDYSRGGVMLDGSSIQPGDLDKSFAAMGITERCYLLVVVKADNAACIKVMTDTAYVVSGKKLADVKKLEKYNPKALSLLDDEGKEVIFRVGSSKGNGSVSTFGVSFCEVPDANGNAVVKMTIPADKVSDPKDWIVDAIGGALAKLGKVEDAMDAAIAVVDAERDAVKAAITNL